MFPALFLQTPLDVENHQEGVVALEMGDGDEGFLFSRSDGPCFLIQPTFFQERSDSWKLIPNE